MWRLLVALYDWSGWKPSGRLPPDRKFVIMGASHTSNFDFLVFLGTVHALGRKARFIGKHSLFKWPMGGFMHALGGVPVDRSSPQDLIGQIVANSIAIRISCWWLLLKEPGRRRPTGRQASIKSR